jgi:enamine deaminase RidA (YjgF/YER057c/UK114 family)
MESACRDAHYSAAYWAGETLMVSGQTGVDADGNVPVDRSAEAGVALARLKRVLEHAGLGLRDVVAITTYHVGDASDIHAWFAPVKDEYLVDPWPAWTAVGVQSLADPNARIEISAVAHRQVST